MRVSEVEDGRRPPAGFAELCELTSRIGRGDSTLVLGKKAYQILTRMTANPEDVAMRSITELAVWLDVNASTLTRLATRLGYTGFVEFQNVFRENLTQRYRNFYSVQAGSLVADKTLGGSAEVETMVRVAHESIRNVEDAIAHLSGEDLKGAVQLLSTARRVRVHGLRQFSSLASFLAYGLGMIRSDVGLLDPQGLGVAEGLAQLQPGDVLLVTSVAPYTVSVIQAAIAAAAAGIIVIAITDTRASPLLSCARHAFFIPHENSFFSNGMGALTVFAEGLLTLVATHLGDRALEALQNRERFITSMQI